MAATLLVFICRVSGDAARIPLPRIRIEGEISQRTKNDVVARATTPATERQSPALTRSGACFTLPAVSSKPLTVVVLVGALSSSLPPGAGMDS